MMRTAALVVLVVAAVSGVSAHAQEVLGEVRVHGNHTTPDADILGIAGLVVGGPVNAAILTEAEERLRRSGRFASVDVRKRFRSIDNPADILVILLVEEVAGISGDDLTPGPFKRLRSLGMWLPVLDYADGYGFTYGARISFVQALGARSRISVPLTWGGERRAGVEVDRTFRRGPFTRAEASAAVSRRVNPYFDIADTRTDVQGRLERALTPWLRVGGGARLTTVRFADADDTFFAPRLDVTLDTRTDPAFPRNAVHVVAAVEQLRFADDGPRIARVSTDARAYVGLFGSSVLAVRAASVRAGEALPPYEQALAGGISTLRGYDFGYRAGDNLAALSAEVRVPLTSPLSVGRLGVKAFVDAAAVYPSGAALSAQRFDRGVGGGAFITWAVVRMGLDVAWPVGASERKPRWHFGLGVTF